MLRRRTINLPSACLPRWYTSGKFHDGKLLHLLKSKDSPRSRISDAIENNLYALAALIVADSKNTSSRWSDTSQIVRGLIAYDPRLLPVNLRALYLLNDSIGIEMDSAEKAMFIDSLIEFGDPGLTRAGLSLLGHVKGGPVPISALMALSAHAKNVDSPPTLVLLWHYLRRHYPRTLVQYSSLITDMLQMFSRKERYRPLAKQIADMCLGGALNPTLVLSIAKASYMLQDDAMAVRLCSKLDVPNDRVTQVLAQLDAVHGRQPRERASALPAQEMSGVIKAISRRDAALGEQVAQSYLDEAGPQHHKHRERLAKAALCNQYIHEGNFTKFIDTYRDLEKLRLGSGILLNLRITWELHHGTFSTAKRHYQNWERMPLKQRAIALNALEALAKDNQDALKWVAAERRVHSLAAMPRRHE